MQIVSQNSAADLARSGAQKRVNWAIRDLAANLFRVARGAGKPYEIGPQAQAVVDTMLAYRDAVGHFPPSEDLAVALPIEKGAEIMERVGENGRARIYAVQDIIHGALQMAASRLLGQRTQESMGHTEMMRGVRDLEEVHAEQLRQWALKNPVRQKALKRRKKKPQQKTKPIVP